jgi:hypothetical protein
MGFVSTTVKDTLKEALVRFAKKHGAIPSQISIVIGWHVDKEKNEEKLSFILMKDWKKVEDLTFKQVANIGKVDLLGREYLATPVLQKSLKHFAQQYETQPEKISFMICTGDKELDERKLRLQCFIYKENNPLMRKRKKSDGVKEDCLITVEEILGEEEIELMK